MTEDEARHFISLYLTLRTCRVNVKRFANQLNKMAKENPQGFDDELMQDLAYKFDPFTGTVAGQPLEDE